MRGAKKHASFVVFGEKGGHPDYKVNSQKSDAQGETWCVYCGHTLGEDDSFAVFLDCAGNECRPDDPNKDDYYSLGSDCAKKAKAAGWVVFRLQNDGSYFPDVRYMISDEEMLIAIQKGSFHLKLTKLRALGFIRGRIPKIEITTDGAEEIERYKREKKTKT